MILSIELYGFYLIENELEPTPSTGATPNHLHELPQYHLPELRGRRGRQTHTDRKDNFSADDIVSGKARLPFGQDSLVTVSAHRRLFGLLYAPLGFQKYHSRKAG